MYCWYCHWGWSAPVVAIYLSAQRDIDDCLELCAANDWNSPADPSSAEMALKYGPAHIVWSDENFDRGSLEYCLEDCNHPRFAHWPPLALAIVRRSLRRLLALPAEICDPCPKDYDGLLPENFPPTVPMAQKP